MSVHPVCLDFFRALAVQTRFTIFHYLKTNSHKINITELVKFLRLSQPTITFHVNKLVQVGLIKKHKVGRNIYCKIENHHACEDCPLS